MFKFTQLLLQQMKSTKLYPFCNQQRDVFLALNKMYCGLVLRYMQDYIDKNCNIMSIDKLDKAMKASISKQGIMKYLEAWVNLDAEAAYHLVSGKAWGLESESQSIVSL